MTKQDEFPIPDPRRFAERARFDFRYGEPSPEDFPDAVWQRLITRHATRDVTAYGPPEGLLEVREAIADYLGRLRGLEADPDRIVVTSGSQEALDLLARVLLDPGDPVVLEEPHYQGARQVFRSVGARLVPVPVDGDGLEVDRLSRFRNRSPKVVLVTPSHQFPTGAILSVGRRLELLEWAAAQNAWVIEDDYDGEYQYAHRPIEPLYTLDDEERVIYVGTFSKVLAPPLRFGYLVVPSELTTVLQRAKWISTRETPRLIQRAMADFIREGHFERHLRRTRAANARRREAMVSALDRHLGGEVEIHGAEAGGHALAWLPNLSRESLPGLLEAALGLGVGLFPVDPFYLKPPQRVGLLMCYVGLSPEDIAEGIERLALAVNRVSRRS